MIIGGQKIDTYVRATDDKREGPVAARIITQVLMRDRYIRDRD